MAKKLDLSRVKDFMFNHGEKVALGVCAFIAIVLGGLKLLDASGASMAEGGNGKTWPQAINETKAGLAQQMDSLQPQKINMDSMKPEFYVWDPITSTYVPSPYAQVREDNDSKRRNPPALTIIDDPKYIRMDYVRSMVFVHDYDKTERTVKGIVPAGAGPAKQPAGDGAGAVGVEDRLKKGQAQTFVVVHAVFPMKKQVEEFRKALKLATQKDLFDAPREDLPQIKGINVVRYELTGIGGKVVSKEPEIIVEYIPGPNETGQLKLQPALETLLRDAMYDETTPPVFEPYLYEGLAMPLPRLAYGRYPRFQFPGWELVWGDDEPEKKDIAMQPPPKKGPEIVIPGGDKKGPKKGANPNPMAPPAAAGSDFEVTKITDTRLRKADIPLSNRLFGKPDSKDRKTDDFNVFHVLGQFWTPPDPANPGGVPAAPPTGPPTGRPGKKGGMAKPSALNGQQFFYAWDIDPPKAVDVGPKKGGPGPKGGKVLPGAKDAAPTAPFAPWERDAIVRFIDADVKPGKTYSYAIQVRVANPNYKLEEKVAALFLAQAAELQDNSSWVTTPSITIPQDYFLYAVDQHLQNELANPAAKKLDAKVPPKDTTTFQIHQWADHRIDQKKVLEGGPYIIGDWVIVERQVVRKGGRIGAIETVEFPAWRPNRDAFGIPGDPRTKTFGGTIVLKGDTKENEAPVLIDFAGGKRWKSNNVLEEETAVDALIMTADGKLRLHNSRDDAAAMQPLAQVGIGTKDDPPYQAISRQERWLTTQKRLQDVKTPPAAAPAPK